MPDERIVEFRRLHASGCFVMPNPWDAGSARALEGMGFPALATTSAGLAWSLGVTDDQLTLDQTLEHLRVVVGAVRVPVNADFKDGFAVDPDSVAVNVEHAVATGIAGLSIEDSSGDASDPLFEFELAVERVRAARRAIDQSGSGVVLTGRSEGYVVGRPDLDDTILRLRAYAEAGADCLYAPRLDSLDDVAAVVAAVSPKPVNLLLNAPFATVGEPHRWECGGSAWAALSPAPLGAGSCRLRERSPRKAPSPDSSGCPMSMRCGRESASRKVQRWKRSRSRARPRGATAR
jgi:2-methylisocitrate lyase-like PEP mutase family enzyme